MDDPAKVPDPNDPEQAERDEARRRAITAQFISEMVFVLMGVALGFLWCHYVEGISNEGNIIMMLLLVIIGLVRYIYLTRK